MSIKYTSNKMNTRGVEYSYYKNKVKRYDSYVLDRICDAIGCQISDIIEHKK